MSVAIPSCPSCKSTHVVKNGKIHNRKQNFRCRDCGGQFGQDPQNKIMPRLPSLLLRVHTDRHSESLFLGED